MATGAFRDALDLGHIVAKYEALQDSKVADRVHYVDFEEGRIQRDPMHHEPVPEHLYRSAPLVGERSTPEQVGNGPLVASTCRTLAVRAPERPGFAWDVNRYYRDLGVPYPFVDATRRDLMRAFYGVQPSGPQDRWLTHCLKQLLDPVIRAEYDAMPRGSRYLNCSYEQDRLKAETAEKKRQYAMQGKYPSVSEILAEEGMVFIPESEDTNLGDSLDEDRLKRHSLPTVGAHWQYAFYVWRTTRWDVDRLAKWQSELISKVAGRIPSLVVGMMGNQPQRFVIAEVGDHTVVFLNRDEDVTDELVTSTVTALMKHNPSALLGTPIR